MSTVGREPPTVRNGSSSAPGSPAPLPPSFDEAGRQLRAPWAASVAGLLFAILFTAGLILLRSQPVVTAGDIELARFYSTGQDLQAVIGGLYLVPFSGVMFLWFIAVVRDQLGAREDRFFATIFFGSGVLFVALVFVATAVAMSASVGVRYLDEPPPTASTVSLLRAVSYALLFAFGTRAAAVFLMATATIGLRSRVFPRWLALAGYAVGLLLLLVVTIVDWIILVLPVWVAVASLYILRIERSRRATLPANETDPGGNEG
jgi:hypothetical protein